MGRSDQQAAHPFEHLRPSGALHFLREPRQRHRHDFPVMQILHAGFLRRIEPQRVDQFEPMIDVLIAPASIRKPTMTMNP